ncbi:helix-turn-helix domain-containing protein [Pseudomonas sp. SA3-5]|uniref:Helix-turn-helix domain-containing protein n=1 Tax=Pseudomonas aestuarii TaxID=3018340 RepID=A0ABT4XBG4_9PSED|nr:helix-turn-helix domain-containing protein [Pseudomonas aestuarii]MDA7085549.1 helix-turn-helix domain-containing protein [Pseudomonas aestuarii]
MTSDLYLHLHPKGSVEDVFSNAMIGQQQLKNAVLEVGEGAVAWALEEAANSLERLQGEFQTVPDLPTPEIRLNLETLILDILMSSLSKTSEHQTLKLIPSMARQAARREVPFSSIVKNMRANQIIWVNNFFTASASLTMTPSTIQRLVTRGAGVVDELIEHFVICYLDERQVLMESQIARRRALVEKLVGNEVTLGPLDLKQIKDDHGLDLQHHHIGIMVSDINAKHSADLGKLQRNLQDAIAGDTALVVSSTQHVTWAWVSTLNAPTTAQIKRLEETLAHLSGARCALGEPAKGPAGFRRTHLQARDVSNAATPSSIRGIMRWADHVLTILLGQDLEKAAWYVDSVLGPLAYTSEKSSGYRQTLGAYLQSGNSLLHGAEILGIHRNTLVYRLQQIEVLLDYPIKERELEIRCALHLVAHFEQRVLKAEAGQPATSV